MEESARLESWDEFRPKVMLQGYSVGAPEQDQTFGLFRQEGWQVNVCRCSNGCMAGVRRGTHAGLQARRGNPAKPWQDAVLARRAGAQ